MSGEVVLYSGFFLPKAVVKSYSGISQIEGPLFKKADREKVRQHDMALKMVLLQSNQINSVLVLNVRIRYFLLQNVEIWYYLSQKSAESRLHIFI